jgi:hypothetical protein
VLGVIVGILVIVRSMVFAGQWVSPLLFISIMFFTMGIQFILLGLLAEIIIRIYYKSQAEATYIIKDVYEKK